MVQSLQSPAHLVNRLPRAYAEPVRELVVIQRTAGTPQFLQDARGNGHAGHGKMISPAVPG
jgi:hypothetical protein